MCIVTREVTHRDVTREPTHRDVTREPTRRDVTREPTRRDVTQEGRRVGGVVGGNSTIKWVLSLLRLTDSNLIHL